MRFILANKPASLRASWLPKLARILEKQFSIQKDISVAFVSARVMQELNNTFRNKNYPTDVLSFRLSTKIKTADDLAGQLFGEVILCVLPMRKRAAEEHKSLAIVFQELLIHAVVHMLGFDHEQSRDAQKMEKLEAGILLKLARNLGRNS